MTSYSVRTASHTLSSSAACRVGRSNCVNLLEQSFLRKFRPLLNKNLIKTRVGFNLSFVTQSVKKSVQNISALQTLYKSNSTAGAVQVEAIPLETDNDHFNLRKINFVRMTGYLFHMIALTLCFRDIKIYNI